MKTDKVFCIGIDLGTSNSAIAVSDGLDMEPTIVEISQRVTPETEEKRKVLPSALYFPHEGELKANSNGVIGLWARERGSEVPNRVVSSAKSWLCQPLVDRKAPILPWKSDISTKVSPVEASRRYLEHMAKALETTFSVDIHSESTKIVLTVPASFDEVARSLTHEAAEMAQLRNVTLLEEPQAALYAWITHNGENWRNQVTPGDIVLVIDIGGGTTDFSLIHIAEDSGNLKLERISVGEHLLLGGDNMDLALAYHLKTKIESGGQNVDTWQFQSLVHQSRAAKEKLLAEELSEVPIAVASKGAGLFAKSLSSKLSSEDVSKLLMDGFFPLTDIADMPQVRKSSGLHEYGLPFVFDAAVSRHLARFLRRSLENIKTNETLKTLVAESFDIKKETFVTPTKILFNGGVFTARPFCDRILKLLRSWSPKKEIQELKSFEVDLAVAKGAAYYARSLWEHKGLRIKAGTARSYYLGVEPSIPAVPGVEIPIRGLCVVPQGLEEGTQLDLEGSEFGLVTGEPVEFRFFSSSVRAGDSVGMVVENAEKDLEESSRLEITLPSLDGKVGETVPVSLEARVTEVGTLELRMKHTRSDQRWNLQFNTRPATALDS
jgi:hypothetical protein